MSDPNRARLQQAVTALSAIDVPLVLLGGVTVGLYLRPDLADLARPTKDVDCLVPVTSRLEWQEFEEKLRSAKFLHDRDVIVRFHHEGGLYDFLPLKGEAASMLGFDATFHDAAYRSAHTLEVGPGSSALVTSLEYLLVTKVGAYRSRGQRDPFASKDLEDLVSLLIGSAWRDALESASGEVLGALADWAQGLLASHELHDLVEGHTPRGPNHAAFAHQVLRALEEIPRFTP